MISKAKLKKMYNYIMLDNEQGLMDEEEVEKVIDYLKEARKRNYDRFSRL